MSVRACSSEYAHTGLNVSARRVTFEFRNLTDVHATAYDTWHLMTCFIHYSLSLERKSYDCLHLFATASNQRTHKKKKRKKNKKKFKANTKSVSPNKKKKCASENCDRPEIETFNVERVTVDGARPKNREHNYY